MKMLFDFIMPLSFWEKMALLVITIGALALLVDLLLKAKKAKKNSKMVKKYLELKNEKWSVLLKILTEDVVLESADVTHKLQLDLSNFNDKYRELIHYDLLAIKRTKEINESNYQTVLDLLLKQK